MEQRDDHGEEPVEVEIPAALADRIERIFTDCRGYEPGSTQESLSVLCDLASREMASSSDAATGDVAAPGPGRRATVDRTGEEPTDHDEDASSDLEDRIDDAFPARWDADPRVRRRLSDVVDRYVTNPNGFSGHDEREADAIAAVARKEGVSPDDLRYGLVSALYGNAGLPDDLAAEFFSEALLSVVEEEEEDDGDDDDPTGNAGDDDLTDDDAFDVESLLGEVSTPTADCERCGTSHPVNDLETVIGSKTATIELLCRDCAGAQR
jgi:hypothetical protein